MIPGIKEQSISSGFPKPVNRAIFPGGAGRSPNCKGLWLVRSREQKACQAHCRARSSAGGSLQGGQFRIQASPCLRDGHLRMENWVPTPFCGPAHMLKAGNSLPRPTYRPRHVLNTLRCRPKSTSEKCSSLWQGEGGESLPWATPSAKLRIKSVFRAWSFPAAWKQEEPNPREQ